LTVYNKNNKHLLHKDYSLPVIAGLIKNKMGNLLYIIAVVLILIWAVGFLGYNAGGLIHILLVIALIAIILRLIKGEKAV
jgi:hypothetical protein